MLTYGYNSGYGMEKTASDMMKEAEVRGVVAAFCDAGLVKVASADAFDDLTEKVAYCLNDYYTVDDVADATSYVIKVAADGEGAAANAGEPGFFSKAWGTTKDKAAAFRDALAEYLSTQAIRDAYAGKNYKDLALESLKYGGKTLGPVAGLGALGYGGNALYDYLSD